MAGSEPGSRGSSPQPPHSDWGRLEAAFLSGWRNFWQSVGKERAAPRASAEETDEEASSLTRLPVSVGRRPRGTEGGALAGAASWGAGEGLARWAQPMPDSVHAALRALSSLEGQQLKRDALALTLGAWQPDRRLLRNSPARSALVTCQVTLRFSPPKRVWVLGYPERLVEEVLKPFQTCWKSMDSVQRLCSQHLSS